MPVHIISPPDDEHSAETLIQAIADIERGETVVQVISLDRQMPLPASWLVITSAGVKVERR